MAITYYISNEFHYRALYALLNGKTIKCALINSYTCTKDDTTFLAGQGVYTAQISAGNGYTAGGATCSFTLTKSDVNDNVVFDIDDPSWTASGGSIGPATGAVVYIADASGYIIEEIDFGEAKTATNGNNFTITISGSGLFKQQQT